MSNNHFVSKIPHSKLKLFWNNILKNSLIPLPIFCFLKNTYFWEISTFLKIMSWYQRRKQGRNWGVGFCYLWCRLNGCKRVLRSNTGWVHSVSSSAILCCCFCSAAVRQFSSIAVRKSWDTRSSCMVWRTVVKQASKQQCCIVDSTTSKAAGYPCRQRLILWHPAPPQLLCLIFRFCSLFLVLAVVSKSPIPV
jgi:hypothetical protein